MHIWRSLQPCWSTGLPETTHCVLQQHHLVLQVDLKGEAAISWAPQRAEALHQGVLVVAIGKGKAAFAGQDCEGHLQQGAGGVIG